MKKILTLCITILIFAVGCESPEIPEQIIYKQEKQMSNFATFTLTENQNDTGVNCISELTYIPDDAKSATLYVNKKLVAGYNLNPDLYDAYKKA